MPAGTESDVETVVIPQGKGETHAPHCLDSETNSRQQALQHEKTQFLGGRMLCFFQAFGWRYSCYSGEHWGCDRMTISCNILHALYWTKLHFIELWLKPLGCIVLEMQRFMYYCEIVWNFFSGKTRLMKSLEGPRKFKYFLGTIAWNGEGNANFPLQSQPFEDTSEGERPLVY